MSNDITSARATARFVRVTPMKARRVLETVRGKSVSEALSILEYAPQSASQPIAKLVASAAANAENNFGLDPRTLVIAQAWADEGPTMTRFRPCIDLHNGDVKQIVGGTLGTSEAELKTNFTSSKPSAHRWARSG